MVIGANSRYSPSQSYRAHTDPMLEISRGKVIGFSKVNKFGHNPSADAGSTGATKQDVWGGGGKYGFYPTEAEGAQFINVASDDPLDTDGGTGAQTVVFQGLDLNWEFAETTATMDGTTGVELDTKFIRMSRAFVRTVGSLDTNAGNIIAYTRAVAPPAPLDPSIAIWITARHGQTQQAIYTIPAGKDGFFIKGYVGLASADKTAHRGEFRWMLRVNAFGPGGAWLTQGEIGLMNTGTSYWIYEYGVPAGAIPEKTDIRVELSESTTSFDVVAGYDLVLIDHGF